MKKKSKRTTGNKDESVANEHVEKPESGREKSRSVKRKATKKVTTTVTATIITAEIAIQPAAADEAPPMTQAQCIIWRDTEVSHRIRQAISSWSGVPLAFITSGATLAQLSNINNGPWDIGQQNDLIREVNNTNPPVFHSVVPEDDNCEMDPLPAVCSGSTTVSEWENIVWQQQNPDCFCKFQYGI